MKVLVFLFGFAGFVVICALSFNYVEGHDSTRVKQERDKWKLKSERVFERSASLLEKLDSLKADVSHLEDTLKEACSLLKAADILNEHLCGEPDEKADEKADGAELEEGSFDAAD